MIKELIKLADLLDESGMEKEADQIDQLISTAIMGPDPEKIRQWQNTKTDKSALHAILDLLGLVPGYGEAADIANAALYLSEGINERNLLLAGLSIISMVPTLGDTAKVIKYGEKLAPELASAIAYQILRNQGKIKAVFDKFKNPSISKHIINKVPKGELLVKNSDRMWNAVRTWFHKILNDQAKRKTQEQVTEENIEKLEDWAVGQLPTL